jgi:hypothetical protein
VRARGLVAAACVCVAAAGAGPGEAAACDRWASARGSDRDSGRADQPVRSIGRLLRRLAPGETGCLEAGATFTGSVRVRKARITVRTAGGRRAEIRGAITIDRGAHGVTLSRLAIRGPRGHRGGIVVVRGSGARLLRNDVTGLSTARRSVHCVVLDRVAGVIVDGNEIHRCTRSASRRFSSAGVLAFRTRGARITNNFVYHVSGDAIALRSAVGSVVHHNLIDGNVSGVVLSGRATSNRIVSNIISRSGRNNVRSTVRPPAGRTNFVAQNCLWHGFRGNLAGAGRGFRNGGNLLADPRFVDRSRSFRIQPGPCFGKRPYADPALRRLPTPARQTVRRQPARPQQPARRAAAAPARPSVVPLFRVRYRLLALPGSVRVVRLTLVGLVRDARIRIVCVRGCRADERLRPGRDGTATVARFRGSRLGRGTVIDVRASRPGAIGHVARITVTGLPRGVRIDHGCRPPGVPVFVSCSRYR